MLAFLYCGHLVKNSIVSWIVVILVNRLLHVDDGAVDKDNYVELGYRNSAQTDQLTPRFHTFADLVNRLIG